MVAMVGGIVGFCGEEVQGAKAQWVGFFNIGSGQVGYCGKRRLTGHVGVLRSTLMLEEC